MVPCAAMALLSRLASVLHWLILSVAVVMELQLPQLGSHRKWLTSGTGGGGGGGAEGGSGETGDVGGGRGGGGGDGGGGSSGGGDGDAQGSPMRCWFLWPGLAYGPCWIS